MFSAQKIKLFFGRLEYWKKREKNNCTPSVYSRPTSTKIAGLKPFYYWNTAPTLFCWLLDHYWLRTFFFTKRTPSSVLWHTPDPTFIDTIIAILANYEFEWRNVTNSLHMKSESVMSKIWFNFYLEMKLCSCLLHINFHKKIKKHFEIY